MKVKDIVAITEIKNGSGIVVFSEDGNTKYGIENSYYKIPDEVLGMEIKKIHAGCDSITLMVEKDPSIKEFDYFEYRKMMREKKKLAK